MLGVTFTNRSALEEAEAARKRSKKHKKVSGCGAVTLEGMLCGAALWGVGVGSNNPSTPRAWRMRTGQEAEEAQVQGQAQEAGGRRTKCVKGCRAGGVGGFRRGR